ncbi:DUF6134 family protein [Caenispirillum bisanense]|uniref:YD repeat-containing protein n=1 Tax=Caenispirillum bisanense TaxID=414052 RepID=A0A286G567_9PROT|nr:DUF6134 family protein [Caenispirillum bisanense]SOD90289.1 hypothetical protein SAMN05421508_101502 [Caenispirillum bisanense]
MPAVRTLAASLLLLSAALPPGAAAAAENPDPLALYGPRMQFDVVRDGAVIGRHDVTFTTEGDALVAEARSEMTVTLLGIPVYRFTYASRDVWRDGRLTGLTATTDDDGDRAQVIATRAGDTLLVDGPQGRLELPGAVFPTNHWNAAARGTGQVLNTITGGLNAVTMTDAGREVVQTRQGPVEATLWTYRGELTADVWYDDAGRWVGLRFPARDGSTITYVCRVCGLDGGGGQLARDGQS